MAFDPLDIVNDYAADTDAQVRQNAATALAAIGSAESIARLSQMALTDNSPEVRKHARSRILGLPDSKTALLAQSLVEYLQNPQTSADAYWLLGWLQSNGLQINLRNDLEVARGRLAFGLHKTLYEGRRKERLWKGVKAGLLGYVIGAFGFYVYLQLLVAMMPMSSELDGDAVAVLISSVFIAIVFTMAAAWRATPGGMHPIAWAGLRSEVAGACITAVVPAGIVGFIMIANDEMRASFMWFLMIPVAGIIRLGTLLPAGITVNRKMRRVSSLMGGIAIGAPALDIAAMIAQPEIMRSPFLVNDAISNSWFILIPVVAALAFVYADIDLETEVSRPLLGPSSGVLFALSMFFLFIISIMALPISTKEGLQQTQFSELSASSGTPLKEEWETVAGVSRSFKVDFPQTITASVNNDSYEIFIENRVGELVARSEYLTVLSTSLSKPGIYKVTAREYRGYIDRFEPDEVLPTVLEGIIGRFANSTSAVRDRLITIKLVLNANSDLDPAKNPELQE